jgi:hypothetical protein
MPGRSDQVVELHYNQETGEPLDADPLRSLPDASHAGNAAFDQPTAPSRFMKKRKKK